MAVGAPLVTILFAETSIETQAKLTLALLLYNGEHVALSQMMVPILRWWARDEIARDEQLQREKELEKQEKRGRQDPIGANAKGAGDGKSESENRVVGHQHTRDEEAVVVR